MPAPTLLASLALSLSPAPLQASDDAPSRIGVVVAPDELRRLEARGLAPSVEATGRPLRELVPVAEPGDSGVPGGYLDLAGVVAAMHALAAAHPTLARVVDVTAMLGLPPTHQGRHIHALVISDHVALDEDEPAFLLATGGGAAESSRARHDHVRPPRLHGRRGQLQRAHPRALPRVPPAGQPHVAVRGARLRAPHAPRRHRRRGRARRP